METTFTRRSLLAGAGAAGALSAASASAQSARGSSEKRMRIGIVGGGFGSTFQWHLHPHCTVEAVCDIRQDRLKLLAETYDCGNTYDNFRDLLKHPSLNTVGVFTPAPLHAWMAMEALKAGKNVISAVPAGMSVEELERLLETVKSTGLKYMMAETSYFRPEVMTARQWSKEGRFGTIFYSESEYHHDGLISIMFDDRGLPTWRHGFPPLHYPTHCTGMIVPVMNERLTEVTAIGWGDGHEVLETNLYNNPFWNATAFFKTSGGHSSRVSIAWHLAAGGAERGSFLGDRMSYLMERPEGSPNTRIQIAKDGQTVIDENGYPEGKVEIEAFKQPNHLEILPERMRIPTGHGGSHSFIAHEFVSAYMEDRHPAVDVWEAIAYTYPGIVAHQSALRDGETLKIKDYGKAPA